MYKITVKNHSFKLDYFYRCLHDLELFKDIALFLLLLLLYFIDLMV